MDISPGDTIDNLVGENVRIAKVLSKHGIDFCSEGNKALKDACDEAQVSLRLMLREIRDTCHYSEVVMPDFYSLRIDDLTRFIEKYHHQNADDAAVFIKTSISRLVRLYGRQYPELVEIKNIFDEMTGHLSVHMKHEEFIVFPYIRQMVKKGRKVKSTIYKSVKSPIGAMMTDHETETLCLKKLDDLTHHYSPPAEGGTAFKITYAAMRELEKDLHAHLALENEVLFPKALEMEISFNKATWNPKRNKAISAILNVNTHYVF